MSSGSSSNVARPRLQSTCSAMVPSARNCTVYCSGLGTSNCSLPLPNQVHSHVASSTPSGSAGAAAVSAAAGTPGTAAAAGSTFGPSSEADTRPGAANAASASSAVKLMILRVMAISFR